MGRNKTTRAIHGNEINNPDVGKINKIYLENFLTYTRCTFMPGKYLNLIIGPNGTGKSSIVSAIVLVFGGDAKLLGRNSQIGSYVRNGYQKATIQAKIHGKRVGEVITFQRSFTTNGESEFQFNGNAITKSGYIKEVSSFNIQISNLCQFLPQDKVQDFAKMNAQEMLLNTITSVCKQDVKDTFMTLQEMRKVQLNGDAEVATLKKKLFESEAKLTELTEVVQNFHTRLKYVENINVCKAKKLYLQMIDIEKISIETYNDLTAATNSFEKFSQEFDLCLNRQNQIDKTMNDLSAQVEKTKHAEVMINEQNSKILKKIDDIVSKITQEKIDFKRKLDEMITKRKDLEEEEKILHLNKVDYESLKEKLKSDDNTNVHTKIEALNNQILNLSQKRMEINKMIDDDYLPKANWLKSTIEKFENISKRKEENMKKTLPHLYEAITWIDKNRHLFQGKVYKPIMLEVSISDTNTMYFEHIIPRRDLQSITCENKSDLSFLVNELTVKLKLPVNICYSPPANKCHYVPTTPISNLTSFGFKTYMIDVIKGPAAILNHLCSLFSIHNIPVGTNEVHKNTDAIPSNIRQYFAENYFYAVSISRYSNQSATMKTPIASKNLLSSSKLEEIKDCKSRLAQCKTKTDELRNQRTQLERKLEDLNGTRCLLKSNLQTFLNQKTLLEKKRSTLMQMERKIEMLKESIDSGNSLEESLTKTISVYLANLKNLLNDKVEHSKKLVTVNSDKIKAYEKLRIYNSEKENIIINISAAEKNKREAQSIVHKIQTKIESLARDRSNKEKLMMELTNKCDPKNKNYPHKKYFDSLPNTVDGVNKEIGEISARVDCMEDVDQEKIKEHEERQDEVNELQSQIQTTNDKLKNIDADIKNMYADWIPKISEVIAHINKSFGQFMANMKYVGEVLLSKVSDYDFDTYGITILVQYRKNATLQALDKRVQSGGERAVATATYTLALQQLTHVPFRCVDEINQGMDANNERKIFEMIVYETTQPGRPQYFLVTPKLLSNLISNDEMNVHVICNGSVDADMLF